MFRKVFTFSIIDASFLSSTEKSLFGKKAKKQRLCRISKLILYSALKTQSLLIYFFLHSYLSKRDLVIFFNSRISISGKSKVYQSNQRIIHKVLQLWHRSQTLMHRVMVLKEIIAISFNRSTLLWIGHGNRDHATSSKRGRLERFTT